ncbi:MAG TPA: hypothetical protein ENK02_15710 [Planctomycetes bacterium]|nr:hypothetical protein [Planctomycetota bacterium]
MHPSGGKTVLFAVFLFLGALLLYLSLGQETFYKIDGQSQILRVTRGTEPHPHHILQDPLLKGFASLLSNSGLRFFVIARTLSSLGMALAVFLAFLAALRLGLDRPRAALAALLVATAPGVLFYASIIEFHGVYLPFATLTLLTCIEAGKRTGLPSLLLLCLAYGLAALVHSSAALLIPFCFLFGLVLSYESTGQWKLRRWLLFPILALLVAVLLKKAVLLLGIVPPIQEGTLRRLAIDRFGPLLGRIPGADWVLYNFEQLRWSDLAFLPHSILREWLLPAFPASILFLFTFGQRGSRLRAGAVLLGLLPFLGLSFVLMTHNDEFGAYVLPMLIPASLLAASTLPRPLLLLGLSIGLVYGVRNVRRHDKRPQAERVRLLRLAESKLGPFTLLCDERPDGWLWPALIAQQHPSAWTLQELGLPQMQEKDLPLVLQRIDALLASEHRRGRSLLLSRGALRLLQDPNRLPIGPRLLESLRAKGRIREFPRPPFSRIGAQLR